MHEGERWLAAPLLGEQGGRDEFSPCLLALGRGGDAGTGLGMARLQTRAMVTGRRSGDKLYKRAKVDIHTNPGGVNTAAKGGVTTAAEGGVKRWQMLCSSAQ